MSTLISKVPPSAQRATLRTLFALPKIARRRIAGRPVRIDGLELDLDAQLLLKMQKLTDRDLASGTPEEARAALEESRSLLPGDPIEPVAVRDLQVPGGAGPRDARLYTPDGLAEGSGLLVYFHGGGWVIGSLDTHDNLCRLLAVEAGVRVLSVDYRLAPEHPFPAAPADALAAFRYATTNSDELGVDASRIAVGGDSAGGNLAAVTSYQAARGGGPLPAFQLLIYPAVDGTVRRRSRELFGDGFFLTDADMTWFLDQYAAAPGDVSDPRLSPLLGDLSGMPPAYLATAGFDPLRDEGEAFAKKLAEAGVPVVARRFDSLIHGYANLFPVIPAGRAAVLDAASALRTGLQLRPRTTTHYDLFRPTT
ncbi:acetyl esterase [Herbihabitans rhizosphaerae]|uniref:Acetyl esterase n=1 Tax=Herbihabitans rhizosphaerae TaxID=1872711 RepID=A0A4Q7KW89_9PSEU|nr:alpha/beta hydrolase [Herbihabitans rhizosphaerae]RZS41328.1 acetyl esterase [Herbihabitans rhizosphaerae]